MSKPRVIGEIYSDICKSYIKRLRVRNKETGVYDEYDVIKQYPLRYLDVGAFDWVSPNDLIPEPFDMVQIETERRVLPGWHDGNKWCIRTIHSDESIIKWRKKKDEV